MTKHESTNAVGKQPAPEPQGHGEQHRMQEWCNSRDQGDAEHLVAVHGGGG